MFWEIMFWATSALLILPLPFKLITLMRGKDERPKLVIIEEFGNFFFFAVGLFAFYGFVYTDKTASYQLFWYIWLGIGVFWSLIAIVKSPKLDYAKEKIGIKATIIFSIISSFFMLPMMVAVYKYAG